MAAAGRDGGGGADPPALRGGLDHQHLTVFRAVMRAGTVTGAGLLLGVTQPAVSRFLAQTEVLAGFALFERVRGRLLPTPKANVLYAETERLFAGAEQVNALCRRLRNEEPRPIALATVPTLTFALLPAVARLWHETGHPEPFSIHSRLVGNVLGLISSRRADLGLVIGIPRSLPGLHNVLLARARTICALPKDHELAQRPVIYARDLHDQPFIALSREEGRQVAIDRALQAAGARPREMVECPMSTAAVTMAAQGVGLTLADAFTALPFLSSVALRPFEPSLAVEYRILWPEGVQAPFDRPALIALLRAEARTVLGRVRAAMAVAQP
ncbi:LysR substrate-binding domain-containing protein [Limobrevibacterium gyesilva]|uniref:LysR substrate-binding domain-containing protein n=1 Tax=Limobrevibacterium gyesilva TaxID=2991712 RepID=A0AA41YSI7_9PROT|nr:LysR substrate-binding domain-containing protein [Limobrevibacterium gyesilva]MCW3474672.1 LysR substrate-binding domain-containing protein [Limobrevibacterium gyesilva]